MATSHGVWNPQAMVEAMVEIAGIDPAMMIVRCSASRPSVVGLALDIATGTTFSHGWLIDRDGATLSLKTYLMETPCLFRFRSPEHDPFLVNLAKVRRFTLQVEGTIPARVILKPMAAHPDALDFLVEQLA